MNIRLAFITGLITLLAAFPAQPQTNNNYFPGATVDQSTMRALKRVEKLYGDGEYKNALLIYEKDLAPMGDKYAQYMVGYMHLSGKSVPVDEARALAWYRLAAERDEPALVNARDDLQKTLSDDELAISNRYFVALWKDIGDNVLILDLIREDMENLGVRTGSRIPGADNGRLTIVPMSADSGGDQYYERLRVRINKRLEYLDGTVGISDIDIDNDEEMKEIKELELEMREELAALDAS